MNFIPALFLCNRKLRSYYTKTLREDAHCGDVASDRRRRKNVPRHILFYAEKFPTGNSI